MNAKALAFLLFLPAAASAQGYAGLGTGAAGFTPVTAPAALAFPRDHAPHPGFRIEWWYVTADLTGPDGTPYGAQWTLFRQATVPGPDRPGWSSPDLWMGHAAATSATEHRFAETFARGGIGQAGVTLDPFHAWIDDWTMTAPEGTAGDALAPSRSPPAATASPTTSPSPPTSRPSRKATAASAPSPTRARPPTITANPSTPSPAASPSTAATSPSPVRPGSTANGRASRSPPTRRAGTGLPSTSRPARS